MPTRAISSAVRRLASLRLRSKCVSSTSRICRPIVSTGFRLVIGSWKIIAISLPRTLRSSESFSLSRSRPSNIARPSVTPPLLARIPRIASDVTLFPQPDSPTMPSVSPGAMSKETPLTACTIPRSVWNLTSRFSTERSGSRLDRIGDPRDVLRVLPPPQLEPADAAAQLRVERLAQAVADQVEAEHGDDDRDAGDDREVRGALQVAVDLRQHRPPLGRAGVLRPETEKAQPGDVDDRGRHRERALDDQR